MIRILLLVSILVTVSAWTEAHANQLISDVSWLDVRTFPNLTEAIVSIKTEGKTILVATPVTADNLSIPDNRSITIMKGGFITVNAGKTLVINGPFSAGQYNIFKGTGSIIFGSGSVSEVHPEWWGLQYGTSVSKLQREINLTALNAALSTQMPVILSGMVAINAPLYIPDGSKLLGISAGGGRLRSKASGLYVDSAFSGDAVIQASGRDDNNPDVWSVATIQDLMIQIVSKPPSELAALDITGFRHSKFDHLQLSGPGESALNSVAIRISDENPSNTSHKSTFFNYITNINATSGAWGTVIKYRQRHGDSNSNRLISVDASGYQGLDLTDSAGFSSSMIFRDMYIATTTGGTNKVVKNGVFPGEAIFENINGEGFDSALSFISFKMSSSYASGGLPADLPALKISGYGPQWFNGRIENYPANHGQPFGIVAELLTPKHGAIALPYGGFGENSNYLEYSEDFTRWTGAGSNVTVTSGQFDPLGSTNAQLLTLSVPSGMIYQRNDSSFAQVQNQSFTFSIWLRTGSGSSDAVLRIEAGRQAAETQPTTITDQWNRYSVTLTPTGTGTTVAAAIRFQPQTAGKSVYVYGASLQPSAYMGAYTRTTSSYAATSTKGFTSNNGVRIGSADVLSGTGSPEGTVAAAPGSLYLNLSGGSGATLYVKQSGAGKSGWVAK